MTRFTTTPEQQSEVYKIAAKMLEKDLSPIFVDEVVQMARVYEGAFELMQLWAEAKSSAERDEIVADLQDEAERLKEMRTETFRAPRIDFDDLEKNAEAVMKFKKELRQLVDSKGGISKLATVSGIPQSSLSRFFSSAAFPRNTTIYRIVNALLPEKARYSWTAPISITQITEMIWEEQKGQKHRSQ
jgi:DNA-binding phage protein